MLSTTDQSTPAERQGRRLATGLLVGSLFAICALALTPGLSQAAPQGPWVLPGADLSATGQESDLLQVAVGPDGTATAVWRRYTGPINTVIQAATRPPGGSFGTPVNLSATGGETYGPQIAIGPDGTATVIWYRETGSDAIIQAATRPPGGSFGAPVDLSATGGYASGPQIAIGPDGTATAVWFRFNDSNNIIQTATRPPGGSFGVPVDLSVTGQDAEDPQIAVGPDGIATTVWRSDGIIQAATSLPDGTFGTPVDVSATSQSANSPQLAIGPDGTATVVWRRSNGSNDIIQAATSLPDDSFGNPVDLSTTGQNAIYPRIAIGPDGTATVVWRRSNGSNDIIQEATRLSSGSFSVPVNLSAALQNAFGPQIAIGPDGTATVVWYRYNGAQNRVQSRTRPPSGSFGGPVNLSAQGRDAYDPQIAIGPDGSATAVWARTNGANFIVQAASTEAPDFTLTVNKSGEGTGTVTSTPAGINCGADCTEDYTSYTKVTLTGTPAAGSSFTGFSGGCSGQSSTCQVTMNEAKAVTATFTADPPKCPAKKIKKRGLKRNKKKGIAKLKVTGGGAGKVILQKSRNNRKSVKKVRASGKGTLKIKARGKALKKLKKRGKVKIKVRYTYKPGSGCASKTKKTKVKLVKKR